jgi:uncharacterized protein YbaP (TraB family)
MPIASSEKVTSYEMELLKKASAKNIPMAGLETVTEQMSFMDQLPYKYQVKELLKVMDEVIDDAGYEELIRVFKEQDIDKLAAEISKQSESAAILETVFLSDRNTKWIPKIEAFIEQQACFIAVGAGHLGGKLGVINLLKEKGYKLTPIR